jgi:hypothetical protein
MRVSSGGNSAKADGEDRQSRRRQHHFQARAAALQALNLAILEGFQDLLLLTETRCH